MKIRTLMQVGHEHTSSQDRIIAIDTVQAGGKLMIEEVPFPFGILAILDGVGGLREGDYAAAFVASSLLLADWKSLTIDDLRQQLIQSSRALVRGKGCATTLSGMLIQQERSYLYHIGNTRVYGLEDGYLSALTEDQTLVVEKGMLNNELYKQRNGHIITGCIGGSSERLVERLQIRDITDRIERYDAFLFTTDGIHEYVDENDLEKAVKGEVCLEMIMRLARENGSKDDCSIMMVDRG